MGDPGGFKALFDLNPFLKLQYPDEQNENGPDRKKNK